MNIEALCHIPKSNYAYAYKENELHIRLRTAKNDLSQVNIIYGIKFDWEKNQKHAMKKILSDQYYDYYQYEIIEKDTRLGYYFELMEEESTLYYTESGVVSKFNDAKAYSYYFQYPFINSNDVHQEPVWIDHTIFYQIFVERFHNGNVKNSPKDLTNWGEKPMAKSFFGGDLQGIIDKLDYLYELGINGIYLTPIFESPTNHKYDIVDYFKIDPYFGNKEILIELVDKAHEKGIKIVLDAVFNHCSDMFPPFIDVVEKGKDSEYYDWFFIEDDHVRTNPPNYKTFGTIWNMPKLNTNNSKVKDYLFEAVRLWTTETGIDGWRLDVSDEIDHVFWRDFRKLVKGINPEAIIIGENWHDSYPWLMGDQFDSIMNYSVTKLCTDFFAYREIAAMDFEQKLSTCLMRYPDQVNNAMLNLLDSHDTERFLSLAGEKKSALKNAAAFLFAYQGMPCTYYGTEIGLTGFYDPDCRKTFDWNKENWDMELFEYYKKLISLRKTQIALQKGRVEFLSKDKIFAMKRTSDEEEITIMINTTDEEQEYVLQMQQGREVIELITGQIWSGTDGEMFIKIPDNTAFYIKAVG